VNNFLFTTGNQIKKCRWNIVFIEFELIDESRTELDKKKKYVRVHYIQSNKVIAMPSIL